MEIKIQLTWKKTLLTLVILLFVIVPSWAYFPIFFAKLTHWMLGDAKVYGDHLGAVGDIYGSLNTLVSSIALLAIAFTTYLQVVSLRETRAVNNEQIKESRHSVFTAKFYGLMNYKLELLHTLKVKDKDNEYKGYEIFVLFHNKMSELLSNEWLELYNIDDKELQEEFHKFARQINGSKEFANWFSYFLIYAELIKLIKNSKIEKHEKSFFEKVVRNSMTMEEQVTLFWIAPFVPKIYPHLKESRIFSVFYNHKYIAYGNRFYDKTYFDSSNWDAAFQKMNK
ncbi:hypothetical protein ACG9Y4_05345 [Acinetobacter guillouiae]|uniref:hypothetical protein n=1 Tax=Acinetobacter guillouiae TaxID=106649 RepID=UPI003AF4D6CB